MWIVMLPLVVPPISQAIAGEFTRIFARAQIDVSRILQHIINAMWDDDAFSKACEIMVVDLKGALRIQCTSSIKVAQVLLFLGIYADDRVVSRLIFSLESHYILKLLIAMLRFLHRRFFVLFDDGNCACPTTVG